MPEVAFSVDQSKSMVDQAVPGHNRWHPDIPPASLGAARRRVPRRVPRVDRRPDRQQRQRQRRPRRQPLHRPHAERADRRSRAPSPATCSWWTSSTSGPASRRRSTATRPARAGGTPASSPRSTAAASSPTTSPMPTRRSGTSTARTPPPATSPASATRASPTRASSAPRPRPTCSPRGTAASRRSSTPIRTACPRSPCRRSRTACSPGPSRGRALDKVGREGARTVPARENGGNHDIKNFTRGSRVFYPVHVAGGAALRRRPALLPGRRRDHLLRRHRDGRLHRLRRRPHQGRHGQVRGDHQPDPHPRSRGAALQRVPHLHRGLGGRDERDEPLPRRHGRLPARVPERDRVPQEVRLQRRQQAYLLLGSAPIEGRISGVVDIPNACCSLYLPTAIFDFDIRPSKDGPVTGNRGTAAQTS